MGNMTQKCNFILLQILIVLFLEDFVLCIPADISKANTTLNISVTSSSTDKALRNPSGKKWQVGRVSRKQYEIVNMLWRKTKIFINQDTTVPIENRFRRNDPRTTIKRITPLTYTSAKSLISPSTASYIEFYYLDENDERVKRRDTLIPTVKKPQRKQQLSDRNTFSQSPILSFHVNNQEHNTKTKELLYTDKPKTAKITPRVKHPVNQKPSIYGFLSSRFKIGYGPMVKPNVQINSKNNLTTALFYVDNETCPYTTIESTEATNSTSESSFTETTTQSKMYFQEINTETTIYDRIKFFEIYDDHTKQPVKSIDTDILMDDDYGNNVKENEIITNQKTYLDDVHRVIGHHDENKVKNVKKHISQTFNPSVDNKKNKNRTENKFNFKTVLFNFNKTAAELRNNFKKVFKNSSRVALWSEYPFAAVYVYEPSQIHCDAAALSPHWLVAAGSCLSRFHSKDSESEGRSAFVVYCSQNWWLPERVSYVKYSIVHPSFHPKDNARRYMYNIGLVKVVGSMTSCTGWAPVSLMSHHFAADSNKSKAKAVGWGLDRYDVRYTPVVLPKVPLSAYDSYVYSDTCPGSTTIGKGIYINEESTMKNTYCLSLPPYFGEQNDPVHGSLLLVGGKLIALYLQEERRTSGEQSAQYTGVWRLVPWVHEVAREPDDAEDFADDL